MKPLIKLHAVRSAFRNDVAFRVRLEYHGWTDAGNESAKWWELSFDGTDHRVLCNYGKIGSRGRTSPLRYDIDKGLEKLREKLDKGYSYVSGSSDAVPTGAPPKAKPAPKKVHPLASMPAPYCTIRTVGYCGEDFVWKAYDARNRVVTRLSEKGAGELLAKLEGRAA